MASFDTAKLLIWFEKLSQRWFTYTYKPKALTHLKFEKLFQYKNKQKVSKNKSSNDILLRKEIVKANLFQFSRTYHIHPI